MRGSKWVNFAEFKIADEQFSDKNFAHFDPFLTFWPSFLRKKKKSNFADSTKISSSGNFFP